MASLEQKLVQISFRNPTLKMKGGQKKSLSYHLPRTATDCTSQNYVRSKFLQNNWLKAELTQGFRKLLQGDWRFNQKHSVHASAATTCTRQEKNIYIQYMFRLSSDVLMIVYCKWGIFIRQMFSACCNKGNTAQRFFRYTDLAATFLVLAY